jgi:N-acetylglucosamine kinase-like BadF-type ATPase
MLPAVLAVDGGNSKTDVALVAADGTLLGSARGPGVTATMQLTDTVGVLGAAARLAAEQAGLRAEGPGGQMARHLSACVANADLPEEEHELAEAVRAEGWSDTVEVANDTFAVLRAGLDDLGPHWGVGVTCGAGINCVGVAPDGRTSRFLSFGPLSGDWGGGHTLGTEAVFSAIRAEDGRGPQTALREAVAAHLGTPNMQDAAVAFHTGALSWEALLGLVPVLFEAAEAGDSVAMDLVRRQAGEVCLMALSAMRRLGLGDQPVTVVLGGGVLTARDPLLIAEITKRLADEVPLAEPRVVEVPPVAGAALLGLDRIGAPPAAHARLRDAYRAASRRQLGQQVAGDRHRRGDIQRVHPAAHRDPHRDVGLIPPPGREAVPLGPEQQREPVLRPGRDVADRRRVRRRGERE